MGCRACQGSRLKHELSLGGREIVLGRAHAQTSTYPVTPPTPEFGVQDGLPRVPGLEPGAQACFGRA